MSDLSSPAKLALMSLRRSPRHNTPYAISNGPFGIDQASEADIANGLWELEGAGLARERHGSWELTVAGRES